MEDQLLLILIKKDDRRAFAQLFDRYHDLVYTQLYNKLRDQAEANDIVQDVFLKLWSSRKELDVQNLPAYLYTIARNQLFSLLRHKAVVDAYTNSYENFVQNGSIQADYLIREKQLREIIQKEIEALPPRMREVFKKSREEHMTNREIAMEFQLSEHTVADQIKKALRQLRLKVGSVSIFLFLNLFL
ncbi:RNA polymerase sigma factor [Pedobacter sp. MW01-1-1]|uniref:RNA polymerase sigma factor n=1 Tax=Pedobacter sp. MW01-1-1 TaxID=3383027 RepID=UPI003FEDC8B8